MGTVGWKFKNSYTHLPEVMFTRLSPTKVSASGMVIFNDSLAENMGLNFSHLNEEECAAIFTGNCLPEGSEPLAQAYAGHQFGHFTMLGDGRAIVLGEHLTPDQRRTDIQFKGSGRTPYSRNGDGKAALGPMLREYIISEAMHALGIPTTRSLAVVATGENVIRETILPGAILTRVAASHLRIGTFQYLAMCGDHETLKTVVLYALDRHYPKLKGNREPALSLLKGVMDRQIDLVIHWMRVGFIHGVMNTDNITISGETIDYGPCAFMNSYDLDTVFSSIDHHGRYAFGNQPIIMQWNLARFAETLLPLLHDDQTRAIEIAEETVNCFNPLFKIRWLEMMRKKLGLFGEESDDEELIAMLLAWMQKHRADYTLTFRSLISENFPVEEMFQEESFKGWYHRWQARLSRHSTVEYSISLMRSNNPAIIPRNHKVEEALSAANENGDLKPLKELLKAVSKPYEIRQDLSHYQTPPPPSEEVYQTFCGT